MTGDRLIDSNIIVALWKPEPIIVSRTALLSTLFVPSIVVGELFFGAYKSVRVAQNVARVEALAAAYTIVSCDEVTAKVYGQIKQALQAKGKPIPENDIWIAAIAMQHNLTLVTRDHHFNEVSGLSIEVW